MNQKQRDYLIKRLGSIKDEKKKLFKVEEIDTEKLAGKLKLISDSKLLELVKTKIAEKVKYRIGNLTESYNSDVDIELKEAFSNASESDKEYKKLEKDRSRLQFVRMQSIENKYNELCDRLIFAESYEEAIKLITEFSKF